LFQAGKKGGGNVIYLGWNGSNSFIMAVINPNVSKTAQRAALAEAIRITRPDRIERIA
jgi:hypothetical protein